MSDGRGPEAQTRIVLRPVGSSLPLGFFAFGIGMLLLGCSATGWIPLAEQSQVGLFLVAFVFPLELVATIFAFLARDGLGATTLGLFGASWVSLGWADRASPPGATSVTLAVYLFGFAAAVLLLAILSALGKPFFALILILSAARMILAGAYQTGADLPWNRAAGGIAIALAALAMYGAAALGLEDVRRRELLPLFRRSGAERAFRGYEEQLDRLGTEPGVRQQL